MAAYYTTHKERITAKHAAYRATHKVEDAAIDAAYRATHKEENAAYAAAYRESHRLEIMAGQEAYYATHKAEKDAYATAYYKSHRVETVARMAAYRATHKEQIAAYQVTYNAAHPEVILFYKQMRRSRKNNAPGTSYITLDLLEQRWDYYGHACYLCGDHATATDHVKPLAKGGAAWPCNLRPICKTCNSIKGAKWPYNFEAHRAKMVTNGST